MLTVGGFAQRRNVTVVNLSKVLAVALLTYDIESTG